MRPSAVRCLVVVCVLAVSLVGAGRQALADCAGPTVEIEQRSVRRGELLTVVGSAWGDNCYDALDPPPGEGVLGNPIDGIDVYIVQGDREWLVATGAADDGYAFEAVVVVPVDVEPGDAVVEARWGAGTVAYSSDPRFVVTDAAPLPLSDDEVTVFAPGVASTLAATTLPTIASQPSVPASSPGELDTGSVETGVELRDDPDPREDSSTNATLIVVGLVIATAAGAFAIGARRKP